MMQHDETCQRKLHRYSKKYPCNCADGSDARRNFLIDKEAEYRANGLCKIEAKNRAAADWHAKDKP